MRSPSLKKKHFEPNFDRMPAKYWPPPAGSDRRRLRADGGGVSDAVDDAGAEAQERRRRQRPDVRSGAPAHREPPVGRGAFYELISSATWVVFTRETRLET